MYIYTYVLWYIFTMIYNYIYCYIIYYFIFYIYYFIFTYIYILLYIDTIIYIRLYIYYYIYTIVYTYHTRLGLWLWFVVGDTLLYNYLGVSCHQMEQISVYIDMSKKIQTRCERIRWSFELKYWMIYDWWFCWPKKYDYVCWSRQSDMIWWSPLGFTYSGGETVERDKMILECDFTTYGGWKRLKKMPVVEPLKSGRSKQHLRRINDESRYLW
jgi:hypothetical protein